MKQFKDEQGYALLVVLLMVVLFLGLSAVFMAGSMSNAKQETTVDTSNLAVAAAEMGVKYHSTDFQREIAVIKADIIEMTQNEIKTLVQCFEKREITCDTQAKLTALENQIDSRMKKEYVDRIREKVNTLVGIGQTPFPTENPTYKVIKSEIIERNESGNDITNTPPNYNDIRSLEIKLTVEGESNETLKNLDGIFTVEVPVTFLSAEKKLTVETVKKTEGLVYSDIFVEKWPTTTTCDSIKNIINAGNIPSTYECVMGSNDTIEDFADLLKSKMIDPADFTVYASDFKKNLCGKNGNCNSASTERIMVVVRPNDALLLGNMNNIENVNFIIDGHFQVDNFQNPGKKSDTQTLIMRELTVLKNMNGKGLENTNLVILGNKTGNDSSMKFEGKATIGDNGRVCFNLDRINTNDLKIFQQNVEFKNDNTTGQIIYFTENLISNPFTLPGIKNGLSSVERTKLYVQGYDNYTTFLSSCGVNVSKTIDKITDIPVPYVNDPDFDLDVEY